MKKIYVLTAIAAVLGLASCSSSDDLNNENGSSTANISLGTSAKTSMSMSSNGKVFNYGGSGSWNSNTGAYKTDTKAYFFIRVSQEVQDASRYNAKLYVPTTAQNGSYFGTTDENQGTVDYSKSANWQSNESSKAYILDSAGVETVKTLSDIPTLSELIACDKSSHDLSKYDNENYKIIWYLVKYEDNIWHVDGVLVNKDTDKVPGGDTPDGDVPTDPETGKTFGSVEVNLGVADEAKDGQIEGHLSVHVRSNTDFEIFMPVAKEYICAADDMMIVQKHDVAYAYNSQTEKLSTTVNGETVNFYVTYAENGITVKSEGMTENILKYLNATYGDGLTFEIRNYYNGLDHAALVKALNQSTVKFTKNPEFYVQAVGRSKEVLDSNPIWVALDSSAATSFGKWKEANVENGIAVGNQSYLKIFKRTDVTVKEEGEE